MLNILVGRHLGNRPEKFKSNWSQGLGGDSIQSKLLMFFLILALAAILFIGAEQF